MMKVFGVPQSRSTRVTWMMEEVGQDYEFDPIDFYAGENRSEQYLAVNPSGKVPALQDGDLVLLESGAIVTYLGDKHPHSGLVPKAGTQDRARHDQWCYFALTELEQPLWTLGKHRFALPEEHRVPAIFDCAAWEYQKALKLLSGGLGDNPYILGSQFSAADILLGHTLNWGVSFNQPLEFDNLAAYRDRLNERPALARARAKEEAAKERKAKD
ncbi:glutathione S-transferase family protein [Pseudomaricurvus alkylphenolicus]|nr:glutathione S-transferase family protein [Pseudomaricurvus alkylphenolicus]